jgi:hypothetical protein
MEETMLMLIRGTLVLGLLLSGWLSGIGGLVEQLTAQIQTMEQIRSRLCEGAGLCGESSLEKMIQTMTRAQTRLQEMAGAGNGPQGPNGPGEANGPGEPNGPNQCAQTCQGADDGCVPCDANGPNGPNGAGEANGPYQCSQSCAGDDDGCEPCEPNGPNGVGDANGPFRCAETCKAGDTDCVQCVACENGPNGPSTATGTGRNNAGEQPATPFGPFQGQYMCQNQQGECLPCAPFGPNFPEVTAP